MRHLILLRSWKKVEIRGEGEFLRARTRRARALLARSNSPSSPSPSPSPSNNCQAVLPLLFCGLQASFPINSLQLLAFCCPGENTVYLLSLIVTLRQEWVTYASSAAIVIYAHKLVIAVKLWGKGVPPST